MTLCRTVYYKLPARSRSGRASGTLAETAALIASNSQTTRDPVGKRFIGNTNSSCASATIYRRDPNSSIEWADDSGRPESGCVPHICTCASVAERSYLNSAQYGRLTVALEFASVLVQKRKGKCPHTTRKLVRRRDEVPRYLYGLCFYRIADLMRLTTCCQKVKPQTTEPNPRASRGR